MIVLGIETSCDETGVALVEAGLRDAPRLLVQTLHTQVTLHAAYGGVVPELASRDHVRRLLPLVCQAMAGVESHLGDIDQIAYTRGPGLAGALLVGAGMATGLAAALGVPAIGVHHLEGHLLSPFLSTDAPSFPFVALLVSGGHTQLFEVTGVGRYSLLGDSIDDAAGEAFDKSAKLLGLGYPGGPALARLAESGDSRRFDLPRPLLHRDSLDFSFAGLKTAVRRHALQPGLLENPQARADLAASTQEAIVDVLVNKASAALERTGLERLVVAGGVSANRQLRERLRAECDKRNCRIHYPDLDLCTDNGAMIALAAAMRWQSGAASTARDHSFDVLPRWPLSSVSVPPA